MLLGILEALPAANTTLYRHFQELEIFLEVKSGANSSPDNNKIV